ncbi:hypothetical protein B0H17DRAFT_1179220 [Mycena rosella]|uniref:F-box domain-containing protein n=1 Tax=Mycena rosella TaxID=1033263 RepID=A0AAD7DJ52_MYCRO|nr:hypothetical protein B0H17DRAFT_1179220 [Mycena rosella]
MSIIRWLPNEILSETMSCLSKRELVALCKTSHLMNDLATPLLYRDISLTTVSSIETFISTAKTYAGSAQSRSRHVRGFSIINPELNVPPDLVADMISVLSDSRHLQVLEFLANVIPPDLPLHAHFPNLTTFRYLAYPQISAFLNRHPTIISLALYRPGAARVEPVDSILLPNLVTYTGPGAFVPSLVCENKTVEVLCIHWYLDDENVETMLATLSCIVSPKHGLILNSDTLNESTFMQHMALTIPHTLILGFRKIATLSGYISFEYALEIAEHLKKFTALSVLEFLSFEADGQDHGGLDFEIVSAWGAACKTLGEVKLRGLDPSALVHCGVNAPERESNDQIAFSYHCQLWTLPGMELCCPLSGEPNTEELVIPRAGTRGDFGSPAPKKGYVASALLVRRESPVDARAELAKVTTSAPGWLFCRPYTPLADGPAVLRVGLTYPKSTTVPQGTGVRNLRGRKWDTHGTKTFGDTALGVERGPWALWLNITREAATSDAASAGWYPGRFRTPDAAKEPERIVVQGRLNDTKGGSKK